MKQKQKKLQKKEEKNQDRKLRLRKLSVKKTAPMKKPKREKKAPMKKPVVKVKAKRREEAKKKKFKNTAFLLDTNTILDRETHKENILALVKGTNNKIWISSLVMAETRKREKTATKKSIMVDLTNLFGDRVEFTEITNEMKKKGEELEKKHQRLGLHSPDCYILAQAIMINAVVITNDQALMDSCEAEGVYVNDHREHVQKKSKKTKKAKVLKPRKTISGQDLDNLIH